MPDLYTGLGSLFSWPTIPLIKNTGRVYKMLGRSIIEKQSLEFPGPRTGSIHAFIFIAHHNAFAPSPSTTLPPSHEFTQQSPRRTPLTLHIHLQRHLPSRIDRALLTRPLLHPPLPTLLIK